MRSPGSRLVGSYFGGLFGLSMLDVTSDPAILFEKDCRRPDFIGLEGLYPPAPPILELLMSSVGWFIPKDEVYVFPAPPA